MSPVRIALFISLEALLLAAPCAGMRTRMRQKAVAGGLVGRLRSELSSAVKSDDAAAIQVVEDLVVQAVTGLERVDEWPCEDVTSGLVGQLGLLLDDLAAFAPEPDTVREVFNISSATLADHTSTLATIVMALDEKRCLPEALQDHTVRDRINAINADKANLVNRQGATQQETERVNLAFARLASWQEALVDLGGQMLDRSELYPKDISSMWNCPQPCTQCTFHHGGAEGLFLSEEKDRFRCLLSEANKDNPPSKDNSKFHCGTPTRRPWAFWEFETWCTLPGWVLDAYQNARISAMTTCGVHKLAATLHSNATMTPELLRTCMLVEQRMVVSISELNAYKDFMGLEDDGVVPVYYQHFFGAYLALATADGLVGLREASTVVPPAMDESWEELLQGSGFTLLPPSLVQSVPCNPPVNNWQVFSGVFAAVAGLGAATMLAALASIPLVLVTGFFFILAGVVFLGEIVYAAESFHHHMPGTVAGTVAQMGVLAASLIPDIFVDIFSKASNTIYNFLAPERPLAACPRGLLFIPGSEPICLSEMNKLDAKRYECPLSQGSMIISCEPEFNGVATLRGNPC